MKNWHHRMRRNGFPHCTNLHQAGHLVCAWNRTQPITEALAAQCNNLEIVNSPSSISDDEQRSGK